MDFQSKCKVIEDIGDEVKILHPLLHDTFRQMDGVTEVEYTHGTNEKGADLVLTRLDAALGRIHFVGVIAKRGKIVSNLDDICRQIEECQMPRKVQGGKEEARLSEVWVVNTSTITKNAQDRIHHKFQGQRIEFISGEKLTELVDRHASYFWHQISSDIGSYLQDLARRLGQQEKELSVLNGLGCTDFYIAPEIQEFSRATYVKTSRPRKPRFVNIHEEVLRAKVSFLEGEMGFGKSKTARYIATHFCAPDRFKHSPIIPIFESFRNLLEQQQTLAQLLAQATKRFFDVNAHSENIYLFILDGLDEATGKYEDWEARLGALVQEAKATDRFHLLITSRPLKRIDEQVTIYAGAHRYLLRPLSMQKLVAFIEKACESLSVPRRLFEDLQKSDLFKQLPQSPIAAALLSRLIAQNSNDLPSNLTELYSKSIENLLGRWDIAKGGCTEKEYRDSEQVAIDLAEYMVCNRLIYMSETEARQRITAWHSDRNTNTDLKVLIERVFEKSGIFTIDSDDGTLSFRHRSFGEYLYALGRYKKHKLLPPEVSFDPYWVSIQFFQTGLLGDCEDHLRGLLGHKPASEMEAWIKTLLMPEYFLAGYQTPYSVVEANLYKLFIDAAYLYEDIRQGKSNTRLLELPEMHLLWFFQRLIRNAFEYEYFRRAVSTTILRIDQEILPEEIKHVALFFAACFAAELNDPEGLEYLIRTYGTEKLPMSISLAIKIEQSTNKDFAKLPLLRAHEKRLNNMLRPSPDKRRVQSLAHSQTIKDLFEKPVKALVHREQKH